WGSTRSRRRGRSRRWWTCTRRGTNLSVKRSSAPCWRLLGSGDGACTGGPTAARYLDHIAPFAVGEAMRKWMCSPGCSSPSQHPYKHDEPGSVVSVPPHVSERGVAVVHSGHVVRLRVRSDCADVARSPWGWVLRWSGRRGCAATHPATQGESHDQAEDA